MASVAELYQTNRANSASPLQRLLTVYDHAIGACQQQNPEQFARALRVLNEALDLQYPVAQQLAALYQWCADLVVRREFDQARRILRELRDSYAEACARAAQQNAPRRPTEESRRVQTLA